MYNKRLTILLIKVGELMKDIYKININYEKIVTPEELNINSLPEKLLREVKKECCKELTKLYREVEEDLYETNYKGKGSNGFIIREPKTVLGEVEIKRRYYNIEGKSVIPLDGYIGLSPMVRVLDQVRLKHVAVAAHSNFRYSQEIEDKKFSVSSVWKWTQKIGERVKEEERKEIEEVMKGKELPEKYEYGFVEADGIFVGVQEGEDKNKEVKVAICYSGREKRYVGGKSDSKKLVDKVVYASIKDSAGEFVEKSSLMFERTHGLSNMRDILVLADGAKWTGGYERDYYSEQAVTHLDRRHLKENIKKGSTYNKELKERAYKIIDDGEYNSWVKLREIHRIYVGIISGIIGMTLSLKSYVKDYIIEPWFSNVVLLVELYEREIKNLNIELEKFEEIIKEKDDPLDKELYGRKIRHFKKKIEKRKVLLKYIKNNKEAIYGSKKLEGKIPTDQLVVGSGGIEKNVDIVIGHRMKGKGRNWSCDGGENMIKILTSILRGKWGETLRETLFMTVEDNKQKVKESIETCNIQLPDTRKETDTLRKTKGQREIFNMEQRLKGNIPVMTGEHWLRDLVKSFSRMTIGDIGRLVSFEPGSISPFREEGILMTN